MLKLECCEEENIADVDMFEDGAEEVTDDIEISLPKNI